MATTPKEKRKEERDKRLDELAEAIKAWADKRTEYLNNQVKFSKRVLTGRTGSERLTKESTNNSTELVVDELAQFLGILKEDV